MAYIFNNDIFLTEDDRETGRRAFPHLFFALDNAALRETFATYDGRANAAKSRSRRWGTIAVLLATIALMIAASSNLYEHLSDEVRRGISIVGATCGIASVLIGSFGVMYRDRKLCWLMDRLATERMRQWHFQHYAAHGGAIVRGAGDPAAAAAYIEKRDRDFETFRAEFLARLEDEFHGIVESDDAGDGLFFDFNDDLPPADDPHLAEYFRTYELLRFQRQIDYCNLLLSEKRSVWKHSPARQAKVFSAIAFMCLAAILLLDSLVFLGSIANLEVLSAPFFSVAGIWMAFLALSARTLEEGLQPGTEVERMRQYRLSLNRSHARFRAGKTPAEKIEPMMDLENASFEEMLPFLTTNYEARFVM
jgi:hypothetical protein